jgi:hypothetical protein
MHRTKNIKEKIDLIFILLYYKIIMELSPEKKTVKHCSKQLCVLLAGAAILLTACDNRGSDGAFKECESRNEQGIVFASQVDPTTSFESAGHRWACVRELNGTSSPFRVVLIK